MSLRLSVQLASSAGCLPTRHKLRRWVQAAIADARPESEVCVRLVDEPEMQALNAQYRGKDYPTNVLSFPADVPAGLDLPLLGDIVVCGPVVAREAEQQGKPAEAHWAHMLVHGTLHLLGYDHITDTDAEEMEQLETVILTSLGYPPPYEHTDIDPRP